MHKRIEISDGFLIMLAALWCVDETNVLPVFLLAALVHELGHLVVLGLSGGRFHKLSLKLCGAVILCSLPENRFSKAAVCLAGPAASFGLTYFAGLAGFYILAGASVILGLFNLVPLPPLDGAMALYHLSEGRLKITRCVLGIASALFLLASGIWLMLKGGGCWLLITGTLLSVNGMKSLAKEGGIV